MGGKGGVKTHSKTTMATLLPAQFAVVTKVIGPQVSLVGPPCGLSPEVEHILSGA